MRYGALILLSIILPYFAGNMAGAYIEKGYVTFSDLKKAVALLIERVKKIEEELKNLKQSTGKKLYIVKADNTRVRLYPWGKVLGLVPKGTKVVVFGKQGEFYITNLGFIHESLLEEEK